MHVIETYHIWQEDSRENKKPTSYEKFPTMFLTSIDFRVPTLHGPTPKIDWVTRCLTTCNVNNIEADTWAYDTAASPVQNVQYGIQSTYAPMNHRRLEGDN